MSSGEFEGMWRCSRPLGTPNGCFLGEDGRLGAWFDALWSVHDPFTSLEFMHGPLGRPVLCEVGGGGGATLTQSYPSASTF